MLVRVMHSFVSGGAGYTTGEVIETTKEFANKGIADGSLMEFANWIKSIAAEHGYTAKVTKAKK